LSSFLFIFFFQVIFLLFHAAFIITGSWKLFPIFRGPLKCFITTKKDNILLIQMITCSFKYTFKAYYSTRGKVICHRQWLKIKSLYYARVTAFHMIYFNFS
jgi:hypothetical protein